MSKQVMITPTSKCPCGKPAVDRNKGSFVCEDCIEAEGEQGYHLANPGNLRTATEGLPVYNIDYHLLQQLAV